MDQDIPEFTTVESIYVRGRNCLLLQADFSPLFVDYYLHLQKNGLRNEQQEDFTLKQLLAFFTLHLTARPWQEYHAWTFNVRSPRLANYFVSGAATDESVVGRAFRENVREPERDMLYAQIIRQGKEPQTSVITLDGTRAEDWVESFYRQSEQRAARAFDLGNDRYALLTAQPDADHDWLSELTAQQVSAIPETEETKRLETRRFQFRCGCTLERLLPVIRSLKKDFADEISEQGFIEANCPRCGAKYKITAQMVQ